MMIISSGFYYIVNKSFKLSSVEFTVFSYSAAYVNSVRFNFLNSSLYIIWTSIGIINRLFALNPVHLTESCAVFFPIHNPN
jgi:hypothetical protein